MKVSKKFSCKFKKRIIMGKKNNKRMLFVFYSEDTNDSTQCCRLIGWLTLLTGKQSAVEAKSTHGNLNWLPMN